MTDRSKKREGNKDSRKKKRCFKQFGYFNVKLKVNTADKQRRF